MYELTKHPTVADRIREESELVCGAKDDAVYTYETIQQLDYTHAVVMETLRLHSPVPDDFKFSVKDDILPDGTHIPAGSCVMYSPYTINHNPSIWGETADQFLPDRFLNTMEPSPFSFPTFNAGPRTCPGKPLALLEIKMALAYLLPRFDFIDATNHKGSYTWTLVMAMESGFPVHVTQRHR
jgi:cytochrome P450